MAGKLVLISLTENARVAMNATDDLREGIEVEPRRSPRKPGGQKSDG
jgi:hypothetical protein